MKNEVSQFPVFQKDGERASWPKRTWTKVGAPILFVVMAPVLVLYFLFAVTAYAGLVLAVRIWERRR